jgi:hypothetical protein
LKHQQRIDRRSAVRGCPACGDGHDPKIAAATAMMRGSLTSVATKGLDESGEPHRRAGANQYAEQHLPET